MRYVRVLAVLAVFVVGSLAAAAADMPGNVTDPQAVQEVLSGKRAVANAAWWGFNEEDSTDALQAAINSGAKRVIVPNMTRDWIVRPIKLAGDQELVFEDGVVITAKRGEYRDKGASVLTAADVSNLTIRGYGATVRMQKEDYIVGKVLLDLGWNRWVGQYEKAEWRMPLRIVGCTNVKVYGLTLRDSGGDGIYIGDTGKQPYCRDIVIKDVVCDNNYRQGMSIIGADGLLVENCVFQNTWGTPPSAGVDLEPNDPQNVLRNVVFRNCLFKDNYGDSFTLHAPRQTVESADISVLVENCRATSKWGAGIRVSKLGDDSPGGLIEFRNCVVEDTQGYGIQVKDKAAERVRVRFVNCTVRNAAKNRAYGGDAAPVLLTLANLLQTKTLGSVDFINCLVEDDKDRPAVLVEGEALNLGLFDVTGDITVRNPYGLKYDLGQKHTNVTLTVKQSEW